MFGLFKKEKCPNCSRGVERGAYFCPHCGIELRKAAAPSPDEKCEDTPATVPADLPAVGAHVFFGNYMGDDIEWVVLKTEKDKALLFCAYSIDLMPYHGKTLSVTWARSDIRRMLNGYFFRTAFTERERVRIRKATLENPGHEGGMGGKETEDMIFLLSIPEVKAYAVPKDLNVSNHIRNKFRESQYDYWLRTPYGDGEAVMSHGGYKYKRYLSDNCGVRPAVWVKF